MANPISFLKFPLAIVCHDAGAANLIIGWLREAPVFELRPHMQGPALNVWQSAFPDTKIVPLDEALSGSAQLLSGSGWASLLEHEAREHARAMGIPILAAVDHWVNYNERFIRNGRELLPDEIWIADDEAFAEARRCFPKLVIRQFPNRYLQTQVDAIHALDGQRKPGQVKRVLYAMEPIRLPWSGEDSRAGEFQALDFFLSRLESLGLNSQVQIRLRPHPSDPPNKYDSWLETHRLEYDVALAPNESISQAVSWADWVAGCESFVLVIALAAGKKTVSTLPPWGNACRLPQKHLVHLSRLP